MVVAFTFSNGPAERHVAGLPEPVPLLELIESAPRQTLAPAGRFGWLGLEGAGEPVLSENSSHTQAARW